MVKLTCYRNHSKTAKNPKRPYEKERLAAESELIGEYGLKNKREVWRLQYALSKIRSAARHLLTLDEHDATRVFQGKALLRRMERLGLLKADQLKLDYVLGLTVAKLMERRLQTLVYKTGLARSVHHARVLVRQGHIRVAKQVVNVPSFLVRIESERHISFATNSPLGGGRPGRVARRKAGSADEE